ncbi:hypothetical protein [Pseudomonas paracarnis]|uniref:hypothetical protein n=1 Tax=Pseudomonas paracarnis TaxID=2750625 RepID=UPI0023DE9F86|nr:hypothetical protein [Pseudomonas paracarnis]MDF3192459.1 hypothetical protein [Pseudomonas paracarnis]
MAKAAPNRAKAETLSLRISPDLKFGLELFSRMEERSLTTEVEKALGELFDRTTVERGFLGVTIVGCKKQYREVCFSEVVALIYTVDAPTRLLRTAILLPRTLSQKDFAILELVSNNSAFLGDSKNVFSATYGHDELLKDILDEYYRFNKPLNIKALRKNWAKINEVVDFALEHGHYPDDLTWE